MKRTLFCLMAFLLLLTAGCAQQAAITLTVPTTYALGAGDAIKVNVYGAEGLNQSFNIPPSGDINLPYIGNINVIGKTLLQVEKIINQGLKGKYVLNPMASVDIAHYRSFFVFGQVQTPNHYQYMPNMTVEKAIALAGGFTDRANRDDISVRLANNTLIHHVSMTSAVGPGDTVIIAQSFF